DQLEHDITTVLTSLANQNPVITILPMQGQTNRYPEVGQFERKTLGVSDHDRATTLQGLRKIQRHPDALIAQAFGSRFDDQRQGFEVAGVLSNERARHLSSFLRRGRPRRRRQFLRKTCATVAALWARCSGLMVPTIALATPGCSNSNWKLARTGSTPGLKQA